MFTGHKYTSFPLDCKEARRRQNIEKFAEVLRQHCDYICLVYQPLKSVGELVEKCQI